MVDGISFRLKSLATFLGLLPSDPAEDKPSKACAPDACAVSAYCCTPGPVCLWRSQSDLRCKPKGLSLESSRSALFLPRLAAVGALDEDAAPWVGSLLGAFFRPYFPKSLCLMPGILESGLEDKCASLNRLTAETAL